MATVNSRSERRTHAAGVLPNAFVYASPTVRSSSSLASPVSREHATDHLAGGPAGAGKLPPDGSPFDGGVASPVTLAVTSESATRATEGAFSPSPSPFTAVAGGLNGTTISGSSPPWRGAPPQLVVSSLNCAPTAFLSRTAETAPAPRGTNQPPSDRARPGGNARGQQQSLGAFAPARVAHEGTLAPGPAASSHAETGEVAFLTPPGASLPPHIVFQRRVLAAQQVPPSRFDNAFCAWLGATRNGWRGEATHAVAAGARSLAPARGQRKSPSSQVQIQVFSALRTEASPPTSGAASSRPARLHPGGPPSSAYSRATTCPVAGRQGGEAFTQPQRTAASASPATAERAREVQAAQPAEGSPRQRPRSSGASSTRGRGRGEAEGLRQHVVELRTGAHPKARSRRLYVDREEDIAAKLVGQVVEKVPGHIAVWVRQGRQLVSPQAARLAPSSAAASAHQGQGHGSSSTLVTYALRYLPEPALHTVVIDNRQHILASTARHSKSEKHTDSLPQNVAPVRIVPHLFGPHAPRRLDCLSASGRLQACRPASPVPRRASPGTAELPNGGAEPVGRGSEDGPRVRGGVEGGPARGAAPSTPPPPSHFLHSTCARGPAQPEAPSGVAASAPRETRPRASPDRAGSVLSRAAGFAFCRPETATRCGGGYFRPLVSCCFEDTATPRLLIPLERREGPSRPAAEAARPAVPLSRPLVSPPQAGAAPPGQRPEVKEAQPATQRERDRARPAGDREGRGAVAAGDSEPSAVRKVPVKRSMSVGVSTTVNAVGQLCVGPEHLRRRSSDIFCPTHLFEPSSGRRNEWQPPLLDSRAMPPESAAGRGVPGHVVEYFFLDACAAARTGKRAAGADADPATDSLAAPSGDSRDARPLAFDAGLPGAADAGAAAASRSSSRSSLSLRWDSRGHVDPSEATPPRSAAGRGTGRRGLYRSVSHTAAFVECRRATCEIYALEDEAFSDSASLPPLELGTRRGTSASPGAARSASVEPSAEPLGEGALLPSLPPKDNAVAEWLLMSGASLSGLDLAQLGCPPQPRAASREETPSQTARPEGGCMRAESGDAREGSEAKTSAETNPREDRGSPPMPAETEAKTVQKPRKNAPPSPPQAARLFAQSQEERRRVAALLVRRLSQGPAVDERKPTENPSARFSENDPRNGDTEGPREGTTRVRELAKKWDRGASQSRQISRRSSSSIPSPRTRGHERFGSGSVDYDDGVGAVYARFGSVAERYLQNLKRPSSVFSSEESSTRTSACRRFSESPRGEGSLRGDDGRQVGVVRGVREEIVSCADAASRDGDGASPSRGPSGTVEKEGNEALEEPEQALALQ
ncbi:conserved hypothetical protein [Neospora caninum Liverpool]|uniref:Uncharacterized protein n=1 Tax=Neospora caninum (strain Liverpool) TaxID=572307 RepID=F0VDL9_NEOCL|nr:conserved hypothetical protein [Neospora caninum Liverpool]CBZ51812.1 conserved hypothetical protein [Neospora caninum Liverpool]CEL65770.1 TPA: hypothetical protein BN1204_016040 [Neospora caninum Liverpool]|eukprot:XP_003881845.1 conserved hypothetical protein [Neospora caninum Liverpool]